MKRFHVHIAVANLEDSIRFYSALFNAQPTVQKTDYAKWMLEDPRLNFAISSRGAAAGIEIAVAAAVAHVHAGAADGDRWRLAQIAMDDIGHGVPREKWQSPTADDKRDRLVFF